MRWTEQDLATYLRRGQPAPVSEAAWMAAVRRIANDAGYTFQYHVWDSRRTVYGWPDLVLCHRDPGHELYLIEAKTDVGQVTLAQQAWLDALAGCTGVVSACWRPSMLEDICQKLRG